MTLAVAYRQVVVIREHQAAVATSEMLAVALAQEELLLFAVISSIPQLVSWKDGDQRYAGSDQAFADFRGLDAAAIVIGRSEQGVAAADDLREVLSGLEQDVVDTGRATLDRSTTLTDPDGRVRTLLVSVMPLADRDGGIDGAGLAHVGAVDGETRVAWMA